jgi:hypothetical protein
MDELTRSTFSPAKDVPACGVYSNAKAICTLATMKRFTGTRHTKVSAPYLTFAPMAHLVKLALHHSKLRQSFPNTILCQAEARARKGGREGIVHGGENMPKGARQVFL